jgi:hypothetical protein
MASKCRTWTLVFTAAVALLPACGGKTAPAADPRPPSNPEPPASPAPAGTPAPTPSPVPAPGNQTAPGLVVSFFFDPLGRGPYVGGVWVSTPTYVGVSGQDAVEARAMFVDSNGASTLVTADWTPADPGMLSVSPGTGDHVLITALRAGTSELDVSWQGTTKRLVVSASSQGSKVAQLEISQ